MYNPVTEKSVRFLAQPYTIAALLLYAVNEFILQRHFPSVISGKLSDFAWLFIAPVILTLLFSLIFPSKRTNTVPILAYALTAIGFTAIKTIPAANAFLLQTWQTIFHHPAAIAMDATDLLALLVLPLSWLVWQGKESKSDSRIYQATLIISFFTLLTLADAPAAPQYGHSLFLHNNKIFAASGYYLYSSIDGGMTWNSEDENIFEFVDEQFKTMQYIEIPETKIAYRISENGDIEKSLDDGKNWKTFHKYETISSIDLYYYAVIKPEAKQVLISPGDMLYDPATGNVIIANGFAGIAVINSSGDYIPVRVDDYVPVDRQLYKDRYVFKMLMGNYLRSALFLFFLLLNFWMAFSRQGFYRFVFFISIPIWIFLVITSYSIPYLVLFYFFISIFMILIQVLLTIAHIQYFKYTIKPHWKITILFALIGSMLFLPPYILWYLGFIELYTATLISFSLTCIWIIVTYRKYHSLVKEMNLGFWKEHKITFFWKSFVFRVYHLTNMEKNESKQ